MTEVAVPATSQLIPEVGEASGTNAQPPSRPRAHDQDGTPRRLPQRLVERIADGAQLCQLVVAPLRLFYGETLPPSLASSLPPGSGSGDARDAGEGDGWRPGTAWVAEVQEALLLRVLVDWGDHLRERGLLDDLLDAWFVPLPAAAAAAAARGHDVDTAADGAHDEAQLGRMGLVHCATLSTLSRLLRHVAPPPVPAREVDLPPSTASPRSAALPAPTVEALRHLCRRLPARLRLELAWRACEAQPNPARAELMWDDAVRGWTAMRDRVANAMGEGMPLHWMGERYADMLADQVESLLRLDASQRGGRGMRPPDSNGKGKAREGGRRRTAAAAPPPATLVMSRLGKLGVFGAWTGAGEDVWPPLLRRVLAHHASSADSATGDDTARRASLRWDDGSSYRAAWQSALGSLDADTQRRVSRSLLAWLDRNVAEAGGARLQCLWRDDEERDDEAASSRGNQRGALSSRMAAVVWLLRLVMRRDALAGRGGGAGGSEPSESSSGTDEETEGELEHLLDGLQLSGVGSSRGVAGQTLTPPVAVCLGRVAWEVCRGSRDGVWEFVAAVLECWADARRVAMTTEAEELYLSTLLATSVARLSQGSKAIQRLSTHPTFLGGVSAHLDSLDPLVRRTGMLTAELVSEAASDATAAAAEAPPGPGEAARKPLSFGRSVWEGRGEGREEARTLRQLFARVRAGQEVWCERANPTPTEWAEVLGVALKEDRKAEDRAEGGEQAALSNGHGHRRGLPRASPRSRRLPERRPAAAPPRPPPLLDALLPPSRGARPMIVEIGATPERGTQNGAAPRSKTMSSAGVEEEEESSSSESNSDDSSDAAADLGGLGDMEGLNLGNQAGKLPNGTGAKADAFREATRAEEEVGTALPSKKRTAAPVYVVGLAPMLRQQERDANRVALKSAEALVRRKEGWGGEVDECAIDLCFALMALQNNFRIKSFEERRTRALAAVVVASPRLAAPCLIEQLFTTHYSLVQRIAVLNALVDAARELAGLPALVRGPDRGLAVGAVEAGATRLADAAIGRARREGEDAVPEIAREKALSVHAPRRSAMKVSVGIEAIVPGAKVALQQPAITLRSRLLAGATVRPRERYVDLAASCFIHPMVTRLWAHLEEATARASRSRVHATLSTTSLLGPLMLSHTLDALSVMLHAASASVDFVRTLAPECLELVLGVHRNLLPFMPNIPLPPTPAASSARAAGVGAAGVDDAEATLATRDNASAVTASLAGLALIALDASLERDGGRHLTSATRSGGAASSLLLFDVERWAEQVFASQQRRHDRVAASLDRSGRASAAVLLRIHQMRELRFSAS